MDLPRLSLTSTAKSQISQILDSSKLKEFADDSLKFDENGRKLSKWVENAVGKGEIARYEQFLLFPQHFQKARFPEASKGVIVWEWVSLSKTTTLSHSNHLQMEQFNIGRKRNGQPAFIIQTFNEVEKKKLLKTFCA